MGLVSTHLIMEEIPLEVPCNKGLGKNWIKRFLKENEFKLQFFIYKCVIINRIYCDKRLMYILYKLNASLKIMIHQSNMLSNLYALNESLYPKRWYVSLHTSYGELYVVEEFSLINDFAHN